MGEMRNSCKNVFGKPKGKGPLGRPRCRWKGDVMMEHRETGCEDVHWIHLAERFL
jgi:hypothetical protein